MRVPSIASRGMGDEQAELHELIKLLDHVRAWHQRTGVDPDASVVDPGSSLAGDDRHSDPYHVSHAVWHALVIAVDHLVCLHDAVVACRDHEPPTVRLHTYAPFTMLRASLENASTAVWLLAPNQRNERILRRLQLAAANVRHSDDTATLIGSPLPRTREVRLDELRRIARARRIPEQDAAKLKYPGYEHILRAAGEVVFNDGVLSVAMWKGCSGLAHGDIWATLSVLEREVRQHAFAANVFNARISAPTGHLVTMVLGAALMVERAFTLFDSRARRQY